jgi:hypothetical protein
MLACISAVNADRPPILEELQFKEALACPPLAALQLRDSAGITPDFLLLI